MNKLFPNSCNMKQNKKDMVRPDVKNYCCASELSIPDEATAVIPLYSADSVSEKFDLFNRETKLPFGFCFTLPSNISYTPKKFDKDRSRIFTSYYEFVSYYDDEEFNRPDYDYAISIADYIAPDYDPSFCDYENRKKDDDFEIYSEVDENDFDCSDGDQSDDYD